MANFRKQFAEAKLIKLLIQERWVSQEAEWRKEKEEKKIEVESVLNKLDSITQVATLLSRG